MGTTPYARHMERLQMLHEHLGHHPASVRQAVEDAHEQLLAEMAEREKRAAEEERAGRPDAA